jgi:hypothetical protein
MTLSYLPQEAEDAKEVETLIKTKVPTAKLHLVAVDLRTEAACAALLEEHMKIFGVLDTL